MSLPTQEFDCPPSKWQGIRRALAAKGVDVPDAMSGEVEHKGVVVWFKRDGNKLRVGVVKMPWRYKFIPESMIISRVRKLFEQV